MITVSTDGVITTLLLEDNVESHNNVNQTNPKDRRKSIDAANDAHKKAADRAEDAQKKLDAAALMQLFKQNTEQITIPAILYNEE